MLKSEIEIEVADKDIDVLGHVNNSVYSSYFAQSRLKWLDDINLTIEDRMQRNIGVVVRKLEINFNGEARLGDVLT
ncbi:acyl-CoA thioesterase, partial [Neobacillus niacini]|uniref:acyl-CoA thioesterase n=1 Tax=Neobacillus niacini TaxID=86668 RepID=UPI003002EFF7